jgi:cation transport regulator
MPYAVNDDLPERVRRVLPVHAQDLYRESFNRALQHCGDEDAAHRLAWAAVKRHYEKLNGVWRPRDAPP